MTDLLPVPVAAYFAAKTPQQIADCFAEDGIAFDERRTHKGREAILHWREEVGKVSFRQEVLSSHADGDTVRVRCRVTGDFKGSPAELVNVFRLKGGKIASLEIS